MLHLITAAVFVHLHTDVIHWWPMCMLHCCTLHLYSSCCHCGSSCCTMVCISIFVLEFVTCHWHVCSASLVACYCVVFDDVSFVHLSVVVFVVCIDHICIVSVDIWHCLLVSVFMFVLHLYASCIITETLFSCNVVLSWYMHLISTLDHPSCCMFAVYIHVTCITCAHLFCSPIILTELLFGHFAPVPFFLCLHLRVLLALAMSSVACLFVFSCIMLGTGLHSCGMVICVWVTGGLVHHWCCSLVICLHFHLNL